MSPEKVLELTGGQSELRLTRGEGTGASRPNLRSRAQKPGGPGNRTGARARRKKTGRARARRTRSQNMAGSRTGKLADWGGGITNDLRSSNVIESMEKLKAGISINAKH